MDHSPEQTASTVGVDLDEGMDPGISPDSRSPPTLFTHSVASFCLSDQRPYK